VADIPGPSPLPPRRLSPRAKHPAKRSRLVVAATSAAAFVGIAGTLAAHAHGSSAAIATPAPDTVATPPPDSGYAAPDNGYAATPAAPSYQGPSNGSYSTQHTTTHAS
jgi:hypothetical protein